MEFDLNQLRELLGILNQTDISELSLKSGDLELRVRKGNSVTTGLPSPGTVPMISIPQPPISPEAPPPPSPETKKWVDIVSPMVGTFYRAPSPDEPPFVEQGDKVRRGQTVCIIEAMKLMNELESELSGEIVEILAENGQPVEYGQTLMRVNPAP
ncbi:acetyl-CoA carboxylase biotin carboxyl carrier protein [Synechococcales cyanobacterium C]|uniref:Biotin carboxyl carrier protein of acetyl-CoA carboxylase n=1 Tax=Petrachloros mirabilis ULC683 TaxID=2781853 RepID=A0A8K2A1E3_9CYAN|nr:acetyl-CoA carboxylase biotin carboxyl carrier protein [Petrachloros mirabilis ULC683]